MKKLISLGILAAAFVAAVSYAQDLGDDSMLRNAMSVRAISDGMTSLASSFTILYNRSFVPGVAPLTTAALPSCLGTGDTTCMVCAPTGATWSCTWGDGLAETVTQGTSPTSYTDPQGRTALDTVTATSLPSITSASARLLAAFNGPHTVLAFGNARNTGGLGGVEPYWKWVSTGGTSEQVRGENDQNTSIQTTAATTIAGGLIMGWGLTGYTLTAQSSGTQTVYGDENNILGATVTFMSSSSGVVRFFEDCNPTCVGGNVSTGSLEALVVYSTAKSQAFIDGARRTAFGLVNDADSPIHVQRDARGWAPPWLTGGRAEPYGRGVPIITSRGLEVHPGGDLNRPQATGWNLDSATTGGAHAGLDASTWAEATGTASTVNVNVASGMFAAFALNSTTGNEMDEIVDASANDVGKKGTLQCADVAASVPGAQSACTVSIVARQGTTGVTKDKMRLGIITDGTVAAPCTSWTRVRDRSTISSLTTTPEAYECNFLVGGSPTSVVGEVLVGAAAADTGSIVVEAPTCSCGINSGGPAVPLPDSVALGADVPWIDSSEVATWCTGQDAECSIEVRGQFDFDLPGSPETNAGSYVVSSSDGATAEIKLLMVQTGASNGHAATDVFIRDGWRATPGGAIATVCPAGSFGNGGTDITSSGTLGSIPAHTPWVARLRIVPAGTLANIPRVDHFLYMDWPATSTQHATTLRASNTSHTMCAGDHGDTYADLGSRTSSPSVTGVNNTTSAAFGGLLVVKGPWPF